MKFRCKTTGKIISWEPIMINASLVSAQNRKRLFWTNIPNVTLPEDRGILLKDILESNVDEKYNVSLRHTQAMINTRKSKKLNIPEENGKSGTITASYYKIPNDGVYIKRIGQIGKGGQGDRIYSPDGKSVGLSALGGGRGAKTGLYVVPVALRNRGSGKKPEYNNTGKANSMTTVQTDSMVEVNEIIRKLTPVECERLQGLPDNYTAYSKVLQIEKEYGNITTWNNVLLKIAQEKKKQISVPVLCTTKDINDIKVLNYLKNKNLQNVDIVIDWQLQENSATNTIRIGVGTKTHFTQIKLENITERQLEANMGILEMVMESGDTETLWKNISEENWIEMKSYTISTLINLIIGLKTSISVQERNICLFTTNLKNLLQNSLKMEQSVSKMGHTSLISNTQRYKALGNAFNCEVIKHIISFIY